jgi:hypothetical protein
MPTPTRLLSFCAIACASFAHLGCQSPYYADRGALTGGLAGAGVGALIGNAVGETAGGAAIGAGVGALTGGAIGGALDDIEARNRAEIASQLGRPVAQGQATVGEVVAMTRAGVNPQLIANYVNNSGMAQPVGAQDVIYLTQQGVPADVIQAMQTPRVAQENTTAEDYASTATLRNYASPGRPRGGRRARTGRFFGPFGRRWCHLKARRLHPVCAPPKGI